MTSSLTDRYVYTTVRQLDDGQRSDVEQELRGTIEDMVDARLEAGAASSREEAERAVLLELGHPVRLAAGYSGRPLYLIGPRVYPQWRRVLTLLLSTLVPLVTAINLVVRLFVADVASEGVGPAVVGALWVGFVVAVNVVLWVTVVFALAERGTVDGVELDWSPDQLPDDDAAGGVGLGETVASVAFLAAAALALLWQQTSSPVLSDGESVPVLDPALWAGPLPWLLLVLAAQAVVVVAAHRRGAWSTGLALADVLLDLAFAVPVLVLLLDDRLFNPDFVAALVEGGWASAERDLTVATAVGVVVVLAWSVVEAVGRVRRSRAAGQASGQA
ncbi:permease prefix domain 1-containing protein [Fodinibacter luteus]|uniref:Permease prefix domain 1-containing protein n=1 Tax=Fodinibacter luteus TaxID=552064 RepID=A0ABP8K813_9MICO